jgi:hypothetical protein
MMNKEYKNFFGGLDADVDIDSPKDFVNQVSDDENTDRSVSGTVDDWLSSLAQYGGDVETFTTPSGQVITGRTGNGTGADVPIAEYAEGTAIRDAFQEKLEDRRKANKKQGLSAFAKGLTQGLGILQSPLSPSEGTEPKLGENSGLITETRNPVIPILIGLIGVAVLFFAISKSKKGNVRPMPMPTA